MKHLLFIPLLLLSLASFPSWAQDFDKGLAAYNSGDYAAALREFIPLAEQGNGNVQNQLGLMYMDAKGVAQDYKAAAEWIRLAAEQGHAEAQFNLGIMYLNGEGVAQDYQIAAKWFRPSAQRGYAMAQGLLGVSYLASGKVRQDYIYAYMWGDIAATNGYESGIGIRDGAAGILTPDEMSAAKALVVECIAKNYKGC